MHSSCNFNNFDTKTHKKYAGTDKFSLQLLTFNDILLAKHFRIYLSIFWLL